jgi:hypothetical protein
LSTTYNTWCDRATGTYEVVRWDNGKATIVQRNILTRAKAIEARNTWRLRQRMVDQGVKETDDA